MAAIDLRLLAQFVAVAEEGGFGRAAVRLHMAQPPLSAAVRRLERELGGPLFVRTSRGVRLTAAGAVFLDEARAVLARADRAVDTGRRAVAGLAGRLRLGFVGSATFDLLPRLLAAFRARHPDVRLDLTEAPTAAQVRSLRADTTDAGLGCPPIHDDDGLLTAEVVFREPYVAAVPAGHPLAARAAIGLAELSDEPFVLFPRDLGPGLHGRILAACQAAGFTPKVAQEAVALQTIAALVVGGVGVALLPASARAVPRSGVGYLDLADPPTHELALIHRRADVSPVLARFRAVLADLTEAPVPPG
ncbi:LysR family transcriptional regulator [Actinokineospora iranica]|uniref:DNA-binding transcriptional regulator, LysR family n=1 Tax=Actinokineospora iranica TaxID=1271860 RepID=A0A1G6S0E3_9PSEU|nr:LysR family transcriptional regulator [Actinokineospora iranica]SDD10390.1 DNA-binding transcriptional regulator, LysR family [Actinokineospora iranica]